MTNILQDGATWLGERLRSVAGRTVIYVRGTQTVEIQGVGVKQRHRLIGRDNLMTNVTAYEWQFKAAQLVIGGQQIEPRQNDLIRETLIGQVITYQVLDLDDETPCFEWLDGSGIEIRVHTKRIR